MNSIDRNESALADVVDVQAPARPSADARRTALRRAWVKVHLYLGLVIGPVLAVIGLTGTLMVFNGPMMSAEYEYYGRASAGPPVPMEQWLRGAESAYPDVVGHAAYVVLPGAKYRWFGSDTALLIYEALDVGASTEDGHLFVVVDPATGRALGRFVYEHGWSGLPYLIHTTLLLPFGPWPATIAVLVLLVSLATGAWLWWPGAGRVVQALRIRRDRGTRVLLHDLHASSGALLVVPLLVIAVSGLYLLQSGWFTALAVPPPAAPISIVAPEDCAAGPLSLDAAAAAAARARPGHQLLSFSMDADPAGSVTFSSAPRGLLRPPAVETTIDRSCRSAAEVETRSGLGDWMIVLHSGEVLNWAGYALAIVAGVVLLGSFVTGLLMWLRRRPRARRPAAART